MTIRINSGCWRGTRIAVADYPGLRPTSSRLRATLSNWLRPRQPFMQVLDLFAGSGVLGLEVYSQAKSRVTFVDKNPNLVKAIEQTSSKLGMSNGRFITGSARKFILRAQERYDLVLLDPPYSLHWLSDLPALVEASRIVSETGLIYLEQKRTHILDVPETWREIKRAQAGQAQITLYKRSQVAS